MNNTLTFKMPKQKEKQFMNDCCELQCMGKLISEAYGPTSVYVNAAVIRYSFFMKNVSPEKEKIMSWQV